MDYSNYSNYPANQHQVVQAATYDPSQPAQTYDPSQPAQTYDPSQPAQTYDPSQPAQNYDPSQPAQTYDSSTAATVGAAQSSYYYYDAQTQQYTAYNPSQDYAGYYYPQQQQTQPIQQYVQAPPELYYQQPGQNPGLQFYQNVDGLLQHPVPQLHIGPFPNRGRGRGGRRKGGRFSRDSTMASTEPNNSSLHTTSAITPSKPPRMEWCELCSVECNTLEILEQHRQGKRHMKSLKVHEQQQNHKQTTTTVVEAVPSVANEHGIAAAADKPQVTETDSSKPKDEEKATNEPLLGKRKMETGRGGNLVKTSKRSVEPPPPKKQAISYICELCNAKCESQVVLDSHLTGKKHLSKLKKAQSHGGYGEAAGLEVVYPPTTLIAPPAQQGATELGSLLAAHGVTSNESQALLAQLIMNYVVSQTQGGAGAPHLQPAIPVADAGAPHVGTAMTGPLRGVSGVGNTATMTDTEMKPPGF